MPLYAAWPARTTKFPNTIQQFTGLLDVPAGQGDAAIPLDNLGWLAWAAMDGVVPYSDAGRQTFMYWTLGDGTGKGPGAGEPIPTVVTQWLAAFHALPIVIAVQEVAQDNTPAAGQELSYLSDQWNYLVRVRRIQDSGQAGPWTAPGGGDPLPGERPIPSGATDALSVNFWLQDQANQRWQLVTDRWPTIRGAIPNAPYPEVALSSQQISSQQFGGVQVEVGGSQVVSASKDASGNVTLITSRVTGYDPATGVTDQESTVLEPPNADTALPYRTLTTPVTTTPATPTPVTSGAGPVASAPGSNVPGLTPSPATNLVPTTFDWQKWGAIAGVFASIAVVLLALRTVVRK